ncbi:Deoxycytidylate deaminase [Phytophthora megakarya]|uniref:dCMP deaminase n=1 Tax=Phytophthora megakarya TaxID=4795 RepID=A0A225WBM0_9STRA|nr:Deoxycytidylate deaminase [Phytophthora megakarya]
MARKLSGRQMMELFYTEVERPPPADGAKEEKDAPAIFLCKCGKTRAQRLKYGYTNLVQHILVKHSDWVEAVTREDHPSPVPALEAQTTGTVEQPTAPTSAVQKRSDYLSWDDYFMSVAFLSAMRSKDPSTQVGACIVNPEKKIVGIGYNGFPNGCGDDDLPWTRESETNSPLDTKYPYVCHAEMNAILNKNSTDVKGCTIYVALFPCNECAKLIIQSGISRVVYCSDKYNADWKFVASRRLLDMAGVKYAQHQLQLSKVVIDFTSVM